MTESLNELRVAILATDGVEQTELSSPRRALEDAGIQVDLVSPKSEIQAWRNEQWSDPVVVDFRLSETEADDYDALILPGGVMNPDKLRMDPQALDFIKSFFESAKPVAAICHGPWLLVEADVVGGREMTSWPSLQTDIRNAGGHWVDREVVVDRNLITSRKPEDLTAFNREILSLLTKRRVGQLRAEKPTEHVRH